MHRIDTSTAQIDKFGTGKNGFSGGNPQTGELPTALNELFFDSVQEEICAVIEGAGNTLNKGQRNQLITALKKLFLQSGNNLSDISNTATALANLGGAALASPTFTGTPKAPTAVAGTNTMQIATTAFVQALVGGLLKTSNNLSEIAAAGIAAQLSSRNNLGLGSAAVASVGTSAGQIPDMSSFVFSKQTNTIVGNMPGGLRVMCGYVSAPTDANGNVSITLPDSFLNRLVYADAVQSNASYSGDVDPFIISSYLPVNGPVSTVFFNVRNTKTGAPLRSSSLQLMYKVEGY